MHKLYNESSLNDLIDVTMDDVRRENNNGEDQLIFIANDGRQWMMCHMQDCCEHVVIEDIVGELCELVGKPIVKATSFSNEDEGFVDSENDNYVSATWTYYEFATVKGNVSIRWHGSSNGCYAETAKLYKLVGETDDATDDNASIADHIEYDQKLLYGNRRKRWE